MYISLTFKRVSLMFLISAFRGRRSPGSDKDSDSEVDEYEEYEVDEDYFSHPPKHPRKWVGFSKVGCAVVIPIVLLLVVGATLFTDVQWLRSQTSSYQEIDGVTRVAQMHVVKTKEPHHMATELILIDNKGHQYYDANCKECIIAGDN